MESVSFDSIAAIYDETRSFDSGCFNAALDFIVERYPPSKYKKLFEPGIGTGRISIPLAEKGYSVTGVDISGEMLKKLAAKLQKRPSLAVTCQKTDVTALPFLDATFDLAVAVHVFHLIRDWKRAMAEVFRVLKPGAPLILAFTGSGAEVPSIKNRYRAICAEWGHPVRAIGMQNETELLEYVLGMGRRVEWVRDRWQWKYRVRVDKTLADIRARFYSPSKLVPDDMHLKVMEKLKLELKQQYGDLAVEVEIPTQINMAFVLSDR